MYNIPKRQLSTILSLRDSVPSLRDGVILSISVHKKNEDFGSILDDSIFFISYFDVISRISSTIDWCITTYYSVINKRVGTGIRTEVLPTHNLLNI